MIISLNKQAENNFQPNTIKGPATILANSTQRVLALTAVGLEAVSIFPGEESKDIRFESRNEYDYASIHLPDFNNLTAVPPFIEVYITHEFLVILSDSSTLEKLETEFVSCDGDGNLPAQMLSILFSYILKQDTDLLEEIDNRIEALEEQSTLRKPEDHSVTIIALRKQLLALKRYFEALYDLLEDLEDNRNNLFSKAQLQIFRVHKNKANRLLNTVLNLRDYLTQVREAFQNQLDISLNETMRFFTVITSIFLPLTLIVGWYGMNLRMPELAFGITYPIVIIVSIVFVILSLLYCKKKGWF